MIYIFEADDFDEDYNDDYNQYDDSYDDYDDDGWGYGRYYDY